MPEIKAILLVPVEGDPHGLLKEGPCGARPPTAYVGGESVLRCPRCRAEFAGAEGKSYPHGVLCSVCKGPVMGVCYPTGECIGGKQALVLAWDGKPVREGCDRADWGDVWKSAPHYPDRDTWATVFALMDHPEDTHVTVDDLRRLCRESGTIVLLDAEGEGGSPRGSGAV
jgi:hypothetical protein